MPERARARFAERTARLDSLSPLAVLGRGYAVAWNADRTTVLRAAADVAPGDRIRVINKEVYLNGVKVDEPYTFHKDDYIDSYRDNFPGDPNTHVESGAYSMLTDNVVNGEVIVPQKMYFAMGDNRDRSLDSRFWGFVPRENIIGKPLVIFWSYDAPTEEWVGNAGNHYLDLAKNFFFKTRWGRTLKLVRGIPVS